MAEGSGWPGKYLHGTRCADRSPDKSKRSSNTKLARILDPVRYRLFEYLNTRAEGNIYSPNSAAVSVPSYNIVYGHDLQRAARFHVSSCTIQGVLPNFEFEFIILMKIYGFL